jgi:hypothetical protein
MARRFMRYDRIVLVSLVATWPRDAFAYLDPGTGSMLFSGLVALFASLYFVARVGLLRLGDFLRGHRRVRHRCDHTRDIVFYSEGRQYWHCFKPILAALEGNGAKIAYWTSDPQDPGLAESPAGVEPECIGSGNRCFARLNTLDAKMCVMTTPGLDVLQLRRSRGVAHYVHVVHSLHDIAQYKLYSFDYFDSVMCSGPYQVHSLRHLEAERRTPEKSCLMTGCTYMDVLLQKRLATPPCDGGATRVLVAPTWGRNGLLARFGAAFLVDLAARGCEVLLRPHPQSWIQEQALLSTLRASLADAAGVRWDADADGNRALQWADVMVSDFSGVVFDCAFVYEKPVITVTSALNPLGTEAIDFSADYVPWEMQALARVGHALEGAEIAALPECVLALARDVTQRDTVRRFRDDSLFHFGNAGATAARQLLDILHG